MVRRLLRAMLVLCALSFAVGGGLVLAALAWRGMWVQGCEGDVSEFRANRT